jgi:hypothetical protein
VKKVCCFEKSDDSVNINRTWRSAQRISKLMQHKPWFNEEFSKLLEQLKQAKLRLVSAESLMPEPSSFDVAIFLLKSWLVGWVVYSSCSDLEYRASVKRFVSLQFLNLRHSVGLPGRVVSPSQGRYLTQTQNKHRQTDMSRVGLRSQRSTKDSYDLDGAATVIGY